MKTPMQELIETFKEIQEDQDPFSIHEAIELAESMLKKEKEVMCEFANIWDKDLAKFLIRPAEDCFDETFNTKYK